MAADIPVMSQELSYEQFRALHERPGAFIMPNARWRALVVRRISLGDALYRVRRQFFATPW